MNVLGKLVPMNIIACKYTNFLRKTNYLFGEKIKTNPKTTILSPALSIDIQLFQ